MACVERPCAGRIGRDRADDHEPVEAHGAPARDYTLTMRNGSFFLAFASSVAGSTSTDGVSSPGNCA